MKERENYQNLVKGYGGIFIVTDQEHFKQMIKVKVVSSLVLIGMVVAVMGVVLYRIL